MWWRATPPIDTSTPSRMRISPEVRWVWNGTMVACTIAATNARIGRYMCERIQVMVPPGMIFLPNLVRFRNGYSAPGLRNSSAVRMPNPMTTASITPPVGVTLPWM